jgi:hypothetical protein
LTNNIFTGLFKTLSAAFTFSSMALTRHEMDGRSPKRMRLEWVGTILESQPYEVDGESDQDNSMHSLDSLSPSKRQRLSFDVDLTANLPDDILAKIFFGGYVNTMEVIQSVSCVSKQLQRVAQEAVKMLDLRACTPALKAEHVSSLVKRFKNVSVSSILFFHLVHVSTVSPVCL